MRWPRYLVNAGYRVIRYDQRGFGETTTEAVPFSNRADVIALLDHLGIGRAALVGNSRGGVIAIDTAVEFPDRFVAVVGVGSGLGGYEGTATPEEMAAYEAMDALEEADPPDVPAIAEAMVRFWVDGPGQSPERVPSAIREAIREQQTDILRPDRVSGDPIPLDPPAEERLSSLTMPILALAGALDSSEMTRHRPTPRGGGPGRPGPHLGRRRPHDRDGAAGTARGPDRGVPDASAPLVVGQSARERGTHKRSRPAPEGTDRR